MIDLNCTNCKHEDCDFWDDPCSTCEAPGYKNYEPNEDKTVKEILQNDLKEDLSNLCHQQWSGWMEYLFEKSTLNQDGTVTIPKWAVDRWKRQIDTPYSELSTEEQNSDRNEADKFMKVLKDRGQKVILAIDPGNIESAYVILNNDLMPTKFEKIKNEELLDRLRKMYFSKVTHVAIEMVACYGMPVGKEVFDTCVWIGRFTEAIENNGDTKVQYIYRKDEKMNLCNSMKANDATIKQALVDRFACGVSNHGKGSKKEPGFFYGFKADCWSSFAVGVTYYDKYIVTEMANKAYNK